MSDLDELRASVPLRSEVLVRRLARRGAPIVGFIGYGILYAVIVVNTSVLIALLGSVLVLAALAGKPLPGWAVGMSTAITVAAFAGAWWPFARWVRRRRGVWLELARHGELVQGRVVAARRHQLRGAPFTSGTIEVSLDGVSRRLAVSFGGHRDDFVEGAAQPVLGHRDSPYALAFPVEGRAVAGRWNA